MVVSLCWWLVGLLFFISVLTFCPPYMWLPKHWQKTVKTSQMMSKLYGKSCSNHKSSQWESLNQGGLLYTWFSSLFPKLKWCSRNNTAISATPGGNNTSVCACPTAKIQYSVHVFHKSVWLHALWDSTATTNKSCTVCPKKCQIKMISGDKHARMARMTPSPETQSCH